VEEDNEEGRRRRRRRKIRNLNCARDLPTTSGEPLGCRD
jgi:hypothetical protein